MVTITTKATKKLATCKKGRNNFSKHQGLPKRPLGLSSPAASASGTTGHCSILCEQTIASEK